MGCRYGRGANRSGFELTSRKCLERLAAALMAPSAVGVVSVAIFGSGRQIGR